MNKLTAKQERFVSEYLIDLNATQAAIRAGYAKKSADVEGSRLLGNAKVAAAVSAGRAKQMQRAEIEADDVIRELAKIGFANMLDYIQIGQDGDAYVNLADLTREQAAAIGEVTVEDFKDGRGEDARDVRRIKFKLADKRAALVDLGRHFALFTDKVEHACVLGLQTEVGSIEPGKRADLQVMDFTDERELGYEFATAGPRFVVCGGSIVKTP